MIGEMVKNKGRCETVAGVQGGRGAVWTVWCPKNTPTTTREKEGDNLIFFRTTL